MFTARKMADNCDKQYVQLYTGAGSKLNMSKDDSKNTDFSQNLNEKPVKVRPKQKKIKIKDEKKVNRGELDEIFDRIRKKKIEQQERRMKKKFEFKRR